MCWILTALLKFVNCFMCIERLIIKLLLGNILIFFLSYVMLKKNKKRQGQAIIYNNCPHLPKRSKLYQPVTCNSILFSMSIVILPTRKVNEPFLFLTQSNNDKKFMLG